MSEELPATEAFSQRTALERLDIVDCVGELVAAQECAIEAVAAAREAIAAAARAAADAVAGGATWHTIGAGSSGRIAALDAVELHPTFGLDPRRICPHLAGGSAAFLGAVEGAEDDGAAGARDVACVNRGDVAVALSASGRAPYVIAALRAARSRSPLRTIAPRRFSRRPITPFISPPGPNRSPDRRASSRERHRRLRSTRSLRR